MGEITSLTRFYSSLTVSRPSFIRLCTPYCCRKERLERKVTDLRLHIHWEPFFLTVLAALSLLLSMVRTHCQQSWERTMFLSALWQWNYLKIWQKRAALETDFNDHIATAVATTSTCFKHVFSSASWEGQAESVLSVCVRESVCVLGWDEGRTIERLRMRRVHLE